MLIRERPLRERTAPAGRSLRLAAPLGNGCTFGKWLHLWVKLVFGLTYVNQRSAGISPRLMHRDKSRCIERMPLCCGLLDEAEL